MTVAYGLLKSTRNSSKDEIQNVNFLYDDIVHILNSVTDQRNGYVLERMFTIQ